MTKRGGEKFFHPPLLALAARTGNYYLKTTGAAIAVPA